MFLFLFIFNFVLMHITFENDNLKSSIRILNEPHFEEDGIDSARDLKDSTSNEVIIYDCTQVSCPFDKMDCSNENQFCQCKEAYTTIDDKICGYEKKKQLVAFLLELFVGFGGGHFYTERYLMASLKLVAFLFGIYIICLFPFTAKCMGDSCDSDWGVIVTSCFYYLYSLGLASWFIIDLVWFGKNLYPDGNNQTLLPW